MTRLQLLRDVVRAKLVYWDAIRTLELDVMHDGDFPDDDAVFNLISSLAAGIDNVDDVDGCVGVDELAYFMKELNL